MYSLCHSLDLNAYLCLDDFIDKRKMLEGIISSTLGFVALSGHFIDFPNYSKYFWLPYIQFNKLKFNYLGFL